MRGKKQNKSRKAIRKAARNGDKAAIMTVRKWDKARVARGFKPGRPHRPQPQPQLQPRPRLHLGYRVVGKQPVPEPWRPLEPPVAEDMDAFNAMFEEPALEQD